MNETLVHRGPDSAGTFADGSAALAARRLSIIDLEGGDQPIGNEDGRIQVVQNGEIYNHAELRERLEGAGHVFRTRCDTEVLVHLYEERGPGFVDELRGMFAIALWDRLERRLVLARDRFGIKPLYYRVEQGTLSFGSELKALLEVPGFSREVDLDALEAFLAFNSIPAPLTIFREARKLPAGHVLIAHAGDVSLRRYARPRPVAEGGRAPRERGGAGGGAARAPARLGPRAPRVGRPGRRDAVRRHRLLGARRARRAGEPVPHQHVLDRVRGALVQRARAGAPGRRPVLHRPPRADSPPGRRRAAAQAGGGLRRAVRGLLGASHLSRLAARRGAREGRALGRGRRRAVRRLLHLRGRHARSADRLACVGRTAAGRAPAELFRQSEPRLQGEALRARRASAGARAPPRLEGDLLAGRAREPAGSGAGPSWTRSTSTALAMPRPRAPTSSRDSRTSTPASTWSTTCS